MLTLRRPLGFTQATVVFDTMFANWATHICVEIRFALCHQNLPIATLSGGN